MDAHESARLIDEIDYLQFVLMSCKTAAGVTRVCAHCDAAGLDSASAHNDVLPIVLFQD